MSGSNSATAIIRFGEYEADLPAGHLRRRGVRVRLRGQAFDVLALLLERAGQVVTREELRHRLWPDDVFVDREQRSFAAAIEHQRKAVELSGGSAAMLRWLGLVLGQSSNTAEARELLEQLHRMAATRYVPPAAFAWIYLGLGDVDSAFECLDRAIDARDQLMMPIKTLPPFDPIRSDPRFAALLRKMNLAP